MLHNIQTYVRYTAQTYVRYTVQTSVRYTVHTYVRYTAPTSVGYTSQTCYRLQLHRTDFSYRLHCVTLHRRLYVTSHTFHCYTGETSVCYISQTLQVTSHSPSIYHHRDLSTIHCTDVTPQISVRRTSQN